MLGYEKWHVLNVFQAIIAKAWSNNVIQNYLNLFPLVSFTKYFDTSTSLIITSYKYW